MFTRKISISDPSILTEMENIVGSQLKAKVLYEFRYCYPGKIEKSNLKTLRVSLREFLGSFMRDNVSYLPLRGDKISLMEPVAYIYPLKKGVYGLKVYTPSCSSFTTEIYALAELTLFKEELQFFQNGEEFSFDALDPNTDAIAVTAPRAVLATNNTARYVIHYVPR